jgi:hypothetical protein
LRLSHVTSPVHVPSGRCPACAFRLRASALFPFNSIQFNSNLLTISRANFRTSPSQPASLSSSIGACVLRGPFMGPLEVHASIALPRRKRQLRWWRGASFADASRRAAGDTWRSRVKQNMISRRRRSLSPLMRTATTASVHDIKMTGYMYACLARVSAPWSARRSRRRYARRALLV